MKLFDFLLHQAKSTSLGTDTHEGSIIKEVKTVMGKSVDAYHSLCITVKCYFNNKAT